MHGDSAARALALRRRRPDLRPEDAAAALAVVDARERARRRGLPHADRIFATPETIAQATSPALADFHAQRLAGSAQVDDPACGIGMDALTLARAGLKVHAREIDPGRAALARANAAVFGVEDRLSIVVGDATAATLGGDALFFDPARRDDAGRASRHAERYSPPLSLWEDARPRLRAGVAKLSPALPDDLLETLGDAVAFLSEGGVCKEACLLHGTAADGLPARCAVLLPEGDVAPSGGEAPVAAECGAWLLDPDPALVRADALAAACAMLNARRLSHDDAYLTADAPSNLPRWASAWKVIEAMPYQPRALGKRLKALDIRSLTVKKRRFPLEPPALHKALGLSGRGPATAALVLVQSGDGHLAILCEPNPA